MLRMARWSSAVPVYEPARAARWSGNSPDRTGCGYPDGLRRGAFELAVVPWYMRRPPVSWRFRSASLSRSSTPPCSPAPSARRPRRAAAARPRGPNMLRATVVAAPPTAPVVVARAMSSGVASGFCDSW